MITIVQQPFQLSLARNEIYFVFVVDHQTLPVNHEIIIKVFFEDEYNSNDFGATELVELSGKVNENKEICFELSSVLSAAFDNSRNINLPTWSSADAYVADNLRKFKIQFAEKFGEPAQLQTLIDSTVFEVMWGGMDKELFATGNFFQSRNIESSLLNNYPARKRTGRNQAEFLKWFNYTQSTQNVLLELKLYTKNGLASTMYPGNYLGLEVLANQTAIVPVGVLQLENHINETILKYEARLIDATSDWENGNVTYLSEKLTYYIDCKEYENNLNLLYYNVFGLPETLRLLGEEKVELEIERNKFLHTITKDYTHTTREIAQYSQSWTNLYTYRTGYISKQEIEALQDLLIYNECYLVTENSYRPIFIESNKFNIKESFQYLYALEFDAVRSLRAIEFNYKKEIEAALIIQSCPVGIVGKYADIASATAANVTTGEYFAYMNFAGIVVQMSPLLTYQNDTTAAIALAAESCYSVAIENSWGLPVGTIRKLNSSVTYNSDTEALAANVAYEAIYYAGNTHESGVPAGTAIIQKIDNN